MKKDGEGQKAEGAASGVWSGQAKCIVGTMTCLAGSTPFFYVKHVILMQQPLYKKDALGKFQKNESLVIGR